MRGSEFHHGTCPLVADFHEPAALKPRLWHEFPLVFDWDEETGKISGTFAARILAFAACRPAPLHPYPQSRDLSPEPLKSKTNMAAIIGFHHELPEDLIGHYPRPWNPETAYAPNVVYAPPSNALTSA
jgi:hypothetical protein